MTIGGRRNGYKYYSHPESRGGILSSKTTLTIFGLVVGVIVGVQLSSSQAPHIRPTSLTSEPHAGAAAAESLNRFLEPSIYSNSPAAAGAAVGAIRDENMLAIIRDYPQAAKDLRSADQPWPKPLSSEELAHWLNILANFTENSAKAATPPVGEDRAVKKIDSHWEHFKREEKVGNVKEWVDKGRCKHADLYMAHILHRLTPWSNGGISKWMVDRSVELGHQRSNFASLLYQIIDDRVFGKYSGNGLYMDLYAGLFTETVRHMKIPNMEFALHNGLDLPVMLKHEPNPMMAYATSDSHTEILVPCTWYIMPLAHGIANDKDHKPEDFETWAGRKGSIFWRGSPNDFFPLKTENWHFAPRLKLVEEGQKHPKLIDAHVSRAVFFLGQSSGWELECSLYKRWNLKAEGLTECDGTNFLEWRKAQEALSVPSGDDPDYRYAVNLDGTGVSERYASQLASNQLVFKVDSPFYNYYSRFFVPWKHFVPIKYDLSDLAEKIEWANTHPKQAYQIMVNAQTYARELFTPDEVMCHNGLTLTAYARLMGYEPTLREDTELFVA